MFENNNCKMEKSIKEVIKMKNIFISMVLVAAVFCTTSAWAAASQTVTVNATVPTMTGGLTVTVSKVTGTVWTTASTISFGTLTWDSINKIFLPASYYAVDVGVTDNSGTVWTLTHTRVSLQKDATNNLNGKVNVSFNKQTSSTVSTELAKYSFGNSQNIAYTKTQLSGGWLRIYYGIGTGEAGKDATGVTPIGLDTPAGTYIGSVTITLTP
ncbi:MAG: hypothetical protein WC731_02615 [Candidatus Omnitrophota bacterium]|jgi:hypothetical protein